MSIVTKRLDGSRCHLVRTGVDLGAGHIVLDGAELAPERGTAEQPPGPHFSAHVYCGQTVAHLSYCWALVIVLQLSTALCIVQVDSTTVAIGIQLPNLPSTNNAQQLHGSNANAICDVIVSLFYVADTDIMNGREASRAGPGRTVAAHSHLYRAHVYKRTCVPMSMFLLRFWKQIRSWKKPVNPRFSASKYK